MKATQNRLSSIEIRNGTVVKSQEHSLAKSEFSRTKIAHSIATAAGGFVVPRILSSQPIDGHIEFERIHEFSTLRQALDSGFRSELLEKAGIALRRIHDWPLESNSVLRPSVPVEARMVFVHGDFSVHNLLVTPEPEITIIDWNVAPWLGQIAMLGPTYVDLSIFIESLFCRGIFSPRRFDEGDAATVFLHSYGVESSESFNLVEFQRYFQSQMDIFENYRRRRHFRRYCSVRPALLRARSFVASL